MRRGERVLSHEREAHRDAAPVRRDTRLGLSNRLSTRLSPRLGLSARLSLSARLDLRLGLSLSSGLGLGARLGGEGGQAAGKAEALLGVWLVRGGSLEGG